MECGKRNLDSQSSITNKLQKAAISTSLPRKRESRKPSKDWIPRIKCGAGLLEFIPLKNGAGMTSRSPRGFFQRPANLIVRRFCNPCLADVSSRRAQSVIRNCRRLSIVCLVLLAACGYKMVGKETHVPPGLNSIAIPTFKNQTFEPGIEVQLTQGFLKEFIQDRRVKVVGRSEADSILEGVITSFNINSVSYDRSGLVLEYQTDAVLDLTLKKRTGEILWTQKNLSESRWYRASSNVLVSESNRTAAIEQLGRFVAERIRNRFFYNF